MRRKIKYIWVIGIAVWIGLAFAGLEYMGETKGLELRTFAMVIKGTYLWFLMPCAILYGVNRLAAEWQPHRHCEPEEEKPKNLRKVLTVIAFLAILLVAGVRSLPYIFGESFPRESVQEDGYIMCVRENMFGDKFYSYYEPVGRIYRKRFSGWTQEELLSRVQERYGEEAEYVEAQENGWYLFRVPDRLAEEQYIYFHVRNTYDVENDGYEKILLSEVCHFWANKGRRVTVDRDDTIVLGSGGELPESGEALSEVKMECLIVTCYDTDEDIEACAADLTDWFDFVKNTGQISWEKLEVSNLLDKIYIWTGEYSSGLGLDSLSDIMEEESWEARYQNIKENIEEIFERHRENEEDYESFDQEQETVPAEDAISAEEADRRFIEDYMANHSDSYEKECLVGDGTVRYRMIVLDAALGSRWYGLLKSSDSGETWEVWSREPFDTMGMGVDFTFLNEEFGFATLMHNGGDSADLYVTENGGKSYEAVVMQDYTVTLSDGYTYTPYDYPQMPYEEDGVIYVLCGQGADGDYDGGDSAGLALYQSTDGGHTFTFVEIQKQGNP